MTSAAPMLTGNTRARTKNPNIQALPPIFSDGRVLQRVGDKCPRCSGQVLPNDEGVHCVQCGWAEWSPRKTSSRKSVVSGRGIIYRHVDDSTQPPVYVDSKYRQARGGILLIPYCPWCGEPMKQPPSGKRTAHQNRYYCEQKHRIKLLETHRWQ